MSADNCPPGSIRSLLAIRSFWALLCAPAQPPNKTEPPTKRGDTSRCVRWCRPEATFLTGRMQSGGLAVAHGTTQAVRVVQSVPPRPSRTMKVNVTGVSSVISLAFGVFHFAVTAGAAPSSAASTKE